MSIETEHLVLHLITPAEAQRIASRTPGPERPDAGPAGRP